MAKFTESKFTKLPPFLESQIHLRSCERVLDLSHGCIHRHNILHTISCGLQISKSPSTDSGKEILTKIKKKNHSKDRSSLKSLGRDTISLQKSELQIPYWATKGQLSWAKRGPITALRKLVVSPKSWFGFALVLPEVLMKKRF